MNSSLPTMATKSATCASNDFVQLYSEEDTLNYKLRTSPATLTGDAGLIEIEGMALPCFSIIAHHVDGLPLIKAAEELDARPFIVRWCCSSCLMDGCYTVVYPKRVASSLTKASSISYARMLEKMGRQQHDCWKTSDSAYRHCDVDVGLLSCFEEAKKWHDFQPHSDIVFAEVKGKDGLWRRAVCPPANTGCSKVAKKKHLIQAFKSCGYGNLSKEVKNFWKEVRVTLCKVFWQTATFRSYKTVSEERERSLIVDTP